MLTNFKTGLEHLFEKSATQNSLFRTGLEDLLEKVAAAFRAVRPMQGKSKLLPIANAGTKNVGEGLQWFTSPHEMMKPNESFGAAARKAWAGIPRSSQSNLPVYSEHGGPVAPGTPAALRPPTITGGTTVAQPPIKPSGPKNQTISDADWSKSNTTWEDHVKQNPRDATAKQKPTQQPRRGLGMGLGLGLGLPLAGAGLAAAYGLSRQNDDDRRRDSLVYAPMQGVNR